MNLLITFKNGKGRIIAGIQDYKFEDFINDFMFEDNPITFVETGEMIFAKDVEEIEEIDDETVELAKEMTR